MRANQAFSDARTTPAPNRISFVPTRLAFHLSAATSRNDELHGAGLKADLSSLLLTCLFSHARGGFGLGLSPRSCRRASRFHFCQQFRGFKPLGRLPKPFQIVELARFLREDVDNKIDIVEQHPLRLLVALGVSYAKSERFQSLVNGIRDCLYLARICAAAHHKVIGERS